MSYRSNTHMGRIVMWVVTLVWAASFIADIVLTEYQPSPFIHLAMMAIIGALFGRDVLRGDDR